MKSHDHHVKLQTILPIGIRDLLYFGPRKALMHFTFQKLCIKVFNLANIQNLKTYVTKTLCILEFWWPLGFFDLQTHIIIHLADELKIYGLLGNMWCYPIEQYLHVLKKYMKNKAKSKGCMASGYM
jgi:hypothetical protein